MSIQADQTLRGRRDLAMLAVLYGAGLRRSELIQLDLAHVAGNRLAVFGKGRQWRTTYLGNAAAALDGWLQLRGTAPGALFFPIHRSGALLARRLSTEAVARIVAQRANAAGVGELRPHDLRRASGLFIVPARPHNEQLHTMRKIAWRPRQSLHWITATPANRPGPVTEDPNWLQRPGDVICQVASLEANVIEYKPIRANHYFRGISAAEPDMDS